MNGWELAGLIAGGVVVGGFIGWAVVVLWLTHDVKSLFRDYP